jgi:hypothetical protein
MREPGSRYHAARGHAQDRRFEVPFVFCLLATAAVPVDSPVIDLLGCSALRQHVLRFNLRKSK